MRSLRGHFNNIRYRLPDDRGCFNLARFLVFPSLQLNDEKSDHNMFFLQLPYWHKNNLKENLYSP